MLASGADPSVPAAYAAQFGGAAYPGKGTRRLPCLRLPAGKFYRGLFVEDLKRRRRK